MSGTTLGLQPTNGDKVDLVQAAQAVNNFVSASPLLTAITNQPGSLLGTAVNTANQYIKLGNSLPGFITGGITAAQWISAGAQFITAANQYLTEYQAGTVSQATAENFATQIGNLAGTTLGTSFGSLFGPTGAALGGALGSQLGGYAAQGETLLTNAATNGVGMIIGTIGYIEGNLAAGDSPSDAFVNGVKSAWNDPSLVQYFSDDDNAEQPSGGNSPGATVLPQQGGTLPTGPGPVDTDGSVTSIYPPNDPVGTNQHAPGEGTEDDAMVSSVPVGATVDYSTNPTPVTVLLGSAGMVLSDAPANNAVIGANTVIGTQGGNDTFVVEGPGNWTINGDGGQDTLEIGGWKEFDAHITQSGNGATVTLPDGSVINTTGIQTITFENGSVPLAAQPPTGGTTPPTTSGPLTNLPSAQPPPTIGMQTDALLDALDVTNPTEGQQINSAGNAENVQLSSVPSLNPVQATFLYAQSFGQEMRTAANELTAGQTVDQAPVIQALNNPAMSGLVNAAETNTGYAEGFGFLAGLATGGALTPNDAGFVNFLDSNIATVGANATGVFGAFVGSANTFLSDPAGIMDAIAKANQSLA